MKKILLSILVLMAGISPALSQEIDTIIQLDEVMIEAPSNKTIIKKAISNLRKPTKETCYFTDYQFTQIMESAGSVIQLSREFGYMFANGYGDKKRNQWDSFWHANCNPVYNARSLRYDITGNNVLAQSYYSTEQLGISSEGFYDARVIYVFEIIRLIYLYGPIYSRNWSDYTFTLKDVTSHSYLIDFESSGNYPAKNPLYAKGQLEIDTESLKLKSIRIDNMGMHYASKYVKYEYEIKKYPNCHDKRILQDCIDCNFGVDTDGDIDYALIHVLWSPDNEQFYKGGRGSQPRNIAEGSNFMVTECWKSEPTKINHDSLQDNRKMSLKERKQIEKISKILIANITRYPEGSTYNPDAIAKIDWALDVSYAERQLNEKMPIQEQYMIQSSDYCLSSDEWNFPKGDSNETQEKDNARKALFELVKSNIFKDLLEN